MKLQTIRVVSGVLGASLLLVLALAGTASASSQYLVPNAYPANVIGQNDGSVSLGTTSASFSCTEAAFQSEVKSPTEEIGIKPVFKGCKGKNAGGTFDVAINMNSCKFILDPGDGTLDIGPSGCGSMTVTAPGCSQQFPAQTDVGSVGYATQGSGSTQTVTLSLALTGLDYSSSGAQCGTLSGTNGTLSGSWTLRAYNSAGDPVGIRAADRLPDGIFLTGSEGQAGNPPRLDAERFPVLLNGEQSGAGKTVIATKAGTITCATASFAGSAASATSTFTGTPSFSGCVLKSNWGTISVTATVNGCTYQYTVAGGPAYSGQLNLICPAGKSVEMKGTLCSVTLPAQTLGTVTYGATGSGPYRAITESVSGKAVKSTGTGFYCNVEGSVEGGTFTRSGTISGSTA
jgi:hypothetical protein